MSQKIICPNCGAEVPLDAKFCAQCGASLETATVPAATAFGEPDAPPAPQQPQSYPQNNADSMTVEPQAETEIQPVQPVSNIWYAAPVVIGLLIDPLLAIISGVILYFMFRKKNPAKAKNILIFSFIWTVLMYILNLAVTYFLPVST